MSRRAVSMRPVIRLVADGHDAAMMDFAAADRGRLDRMHHRRSLLALRLAARELRGARMVLVAARRVNAGEGLSRPSRCDGAMVARARERCERIEREVAVIYAGRWLV